MVMYNKSTGRVGPAGLESAEATRYELLKDVFNAAVAAVHPDYSVRKVLQREDSKLNVAGAVYDLDAFARVVVIGAGKAAAPMAAAVEGVLGDVVDGGAVVVKYGHTSGLRAIEEIEADHPIPDKAGLYGTQKILDTLRGVDAKTLVLCLLSGGASALLVSPMPGLGLEDKQKTADLLLRTGASVYETNTVLKHLSGVKGGRLARAAYPASVLTLTLSDVIGDRMDVIASGPMAPGNATFCEAVQIIEKLGLRYKLPDRVVSFIERGAAGREPETANSGEPCFRKTRTVIAGGAAQALFSAAGKAKAAGYDTEIMLNETSGPAQQTARALAKKALRLRDLLDPGERRCLLFGSERTSTPAGNGKNGRSREIALAFAREIAGIRGVALLSAGTDYTPGPAGAVVDGTTTSLARACGISPQACLDSHEAHVFFEKLESYHAAGFDIVSGPAGTNALDLQIILVEA